MKLRFNFGITASLIAMVALASEASAAQIFKDVTSTDINTVGNWSTTSLASTPDPSAIGTTDTLRFNEYFAPTSGTNYTASISSDLSTGGIKLDFGADGGGTAFGNVTINGTSALTLNGTSSADSQYAGAVFILNSATGGTLTVNPNVVIGAANTQIVASRNLTLNGTLNWGTFGMANNIAGTASLTTVSGVVSGSGNWSKSGAGTYHFNNVANDFTGSVTVAGGTLRVEKLADGGSTSSIGSGSSAIVLNGGTLATSATGVGGSTNRAIDMRAGAALVSNGTGTISFTASNVTQGGTASARLLTLNGTNTGDNTLGSIVGDSGTGANITSITKTGVGTWVLSGENTYTGTTTVNQGILKVTGSGVLGGKSGSVANPNNIVFGSNLNSGAIQFQTASNLGAADQIRFRNTGGTAGQGGNLIYAGTTAQVVTKAIQCDTNVGVRLTSNSVGGSVEFSGSWANTSGNRPIYLGGTGTGDNTISGSIENNGSGTLNKVDTGKWILSGTNTYTGATSVSAGTLLVTGALGNSAVGVSNAGTAFGGSGSLGGSLTLNADTLFYVADLSDPLLVTGSVSLYSGFGVDDLAGLTWSSVNNGTYTLIGGTLGAGVFDSLAHNSLGSAYDIGGGRSAYFQQGSLQLVVIPESSTALLGGLGLLAMLRRRRVKA